LVTYIIAL